MKIYIRILIALAGGLFFGAIISVLSPGDFITGFFAISALLFVLFFILISCWYWAGGSRMLAWIMVLAFILRLGLGMVLSLALPESGYDNPQQKAGYPFNDSFIRDQAAWTLAQSKTPLWTTFSKEFASDQYGGLLSLSAATYRGLSADAHRPFLILVLAAFVFTLGVPFFYNGLAHRWGKQFANLATWMLVLYPEGIFFSLSQMREPFLIGLGAIATWGILTWKGKKRWASVALLGSLGSMALISWRVTTVLVIILAVWFGLENFTRIGNWHWKMPRWFPFAIVTLVIVLIVTSWTWLRSSMWWDFLLTERNSERLVIEIENIGAQWRPLIIIGFGMTQVILPAAIAQPAIALWRGITIVRSAGWYLLAPFLLYSVLVIRKAKNTKDRRVLYWLILSAFVWIIIASARAGGDLWDNPRYRTIFLPWLALLAAWAWKQRGEWLWRLLTIEGIFLVFFTEWYLARYYYGTWLRMPFWHIIAWIAVTGGLVFIDGLIISFWRYKFHCEPRRLRMRLIEGILLALYFEWYVTHHYYSQWMNTSFWHSFRWIMIIAALAVVIYAVWDSFRFLKKISTTKELKMNKRNGDD